MFINDGDPLVEATIPVTTYDGSSMTHTLTDIADTLTSGLIYKFVFRATNSQGESEDSPVASFALSNKPAAPGSPLRMLSLTTEK